jgi:hypothetical protein
MNLSESGDTTIAGKLVRFLRSGVKRELAASLDVLAFEVDKNIDPETYYGALARWPRLVLKALESQHDAELIRLEDAHAGGLDLPARDIQALGYLVASISEQVGTPPRIPTSFPGRHLPRRTRRTRGNG